MAAPAKLNLGLHVLRRRADGFHAIETVMLPIGWADQLSASRSPRLTLRCSDPALPTGEGNLVVQAANALAAWAGIAPGAELHLEKCVPYGAGLGSGSADAAVTLRLLSRLWGLSVPELELHALAATLGSDVPFFLLGGAALATGRGEVLAPLVDAGGTPYHCPFWLVVGVPPVQVSTAEAYRLVVPDDGSRPDLADLVGSNDLARWRTELVNDFEAPIFSRYPVIASAKQALLDEGAGYAALSGSGAAVFGVFEEEGVACRARDRLGTQGYRVWIEGPAVP